MVSRDRVGCAVQRAYPSCRRHSLSPDDCSAPERGRMRSTVAMRTAGVPFAAGAGLSAAAPTLSLTFDFQRGVEARDSEAGRASAGSGVDGVGPLKAAAASESSPFEG